MHGVARPAGFPIGRTPCVPKFLNSKPFTLQKPQSRAFALTYWGACLPSGLYTAVSGIAALNMTSKPYNFGEFRDLDAKERVLGKPATHAIRSFPLLTSTSFMQT